MHIQPPQPVTGHFRYRADFGRQGRRCPLSRGLGGFSLSSRHGGQVTWKAVPDPERQPGAVETPRSTGVAADGIPINGRYRAQIGISRRSWRATDRQSSCSRSCVPSPVTAKVRITPGLRRRHAPYSSCDAPGSRLVKSCQAAYLSRGLARGGEMIQVAMALILFLGGSAFMFAGPPITPRARATRVRAEARSSPRVARTLVHRGVQKIQHVSAPTWLPPREWGVRRQNLMNLLSAPVH